MSLELKELKVEFVNSKTNETWNVIYYPIGECKFKVEILKNNNMFYMFGEIPYSIKNKVKHPNKTQAKHLIVLAKKEAN